MEGGSGRAVRSVHLSHCRCCSPREIAASCLLASSTPRPTPHPHWRPPALPASPAAAAALQYGIERDFTNRTDHVILYDLGAASLQAALVTYSAYTGPKVRQGGSAGVRTTADCRMCTSGAGRATQRVSDTPTRRAAVQAPAPHADLRLMCPASPCLCMQGVSISQFDVRDVVWRENLGGEHLELGEWRAWEGWGGH